MDVYQVSFTPLTPANEIKSASFRFEKGVTPSAGVIVTPIQTIAQPVGTLTFTNALGAGGSETITLPDCMIAGVEPGGPGVMRLTVLDRRWRWSYGHIDGLYNVRVAEDEYEHPKTAKQLVELLLDAMGETGYDTTAVTSTKKPLADWRGDIPAKLLGELLYTLGLELTLTAGNVVKIVEQGTGAALPTGALTTLGVSVTTGALPSAVRVSCANVKYQTKFKLEAVGLEANGDVKPIGQLSYKPDDIWNSMRFPEWANVDADSRHLAQQSVYKWYRIKEQAHTAANWAPPGFVGTPAAIDSRDKILPLLPQLNKENIDLDTNRKLPAPAEVTGSYYKHNDLPPLAGNTSAGTKYPHGFTIDEKRGIVKFSRPVFSISEEFHIVIEADLRLECVVEVDDPDTNTKQYYAYTKGAGGGSGVYTIDRPELIPKVTPVYDGDSVEQHDHDSDGGTPDVDNISTNFADLDTEAEKFADVEIAAMTPRAEGTATYAGFKPIELDGWREFVQWSAEEGRGCFTSASLSSQPSRRRQEEVDQFRLERRRGQRKRVFEVEQQRIPEAGQP